MIETLGWTGSFLLSFCGVPEAYATYKRGHTQISLGFLSMWGFGELFTLIYVMPKGYLPLILNYALNLGLVAVIMHYKYNPRINNVKEKIQSI